MAGGAGRGAGRWRGGSARCSPASIPVAGLLAVHLPLDACQGNQPFTGESAAWARTRATTSGGGRASGAPVDCAATWMRQDCSR